MRRRVSAFSPLRAPREESSEGDLAVRCYFHDPCSTSLRNCLSGGLVSVSNGPVPTTSVVCWTDSWKERAFTWGRHPNKLNRAHTSVPSKVFEGVISSYPEVHR